MFEGYGQLDTIHLLSEGKGTSMYNIYERVGEEFRLVCSWGERINIKLTRMLEGGRLYAGDFDLRRVYSGWETFGMFKPDELELVVLDELYLEPIKFPIIRSDRTSSKLEVVAYSLPYSLYSNDGRVVVKRGKMKKVEGEYLFEQFKKGRKFYARKADLS